MQKYADTGSAVKKAKKEYEKFIKNQKLRDAQLRHEMWLHDRAQEKYDAREDGLAEGRAAGREMGLKEGHAEGHAQGLQEGAKREAACSMKNDGLAVSKIAEYTGLSEKEIAQL
jgi:predicted transposase/invertase (TIGR01784 family)